MIELLKRNIETEMAMLREVSSYSQIMLRVGEIEKRQIESAINALIESISIINNNVPEFLSELGSKSNEVKKETVKLEEITYIREGSPVRAILNSKDKQRFLKELSISENILKKLKKRRVIKEEVYTEFKAARGYIKLSNKYFLNKAIELVKKGKFRDLYPELKRSNMDILFESYIAMMFFTTIISAILAVFVGFFLLFFDVGLSSPFFSIYKDGYLKRFLIVVVASIAIPVSTFFAIYYYPSTEKSSISKKIEGELPFAVIHMSSISGSGISPQEIFKIIVNSKEYPNLRREIRKVINQTNIYGYDLVTALLNASKVSPSQKLSELFTGISTTISSGGNLSDFFEKRSETLLAGYRLEREKFSHLAETFMDIYISVVIATPMILMLLLVMISLTVSTFSLSPMMMSFIIIALIALINTVFLGFLHIKQPAY